MNQELRYQTSHTCTAGLSSQDISCVHLICHLGIDIPFNLNAVGGFELTHPVTPNYILLQEVNQRLNNSIKQLAFPRLRCVLVCVFKRGGVFVSLCMLTGLS